jgi:hypothetical protein
LSTAPKPTEFAEWQSWALKQLAEFLNLPERPEAEWRVRRPTTSAYRAAVDLITAADAMDVPSPRVAPDKEGGIQLEWEKGIYELEISVSPTGSFEFLKAAVTEFEEGIIGFDRARELINWLAQA